MDIYDVDKLDVAPVGDEELAWVTSQFEVLQQQYAGRWIAVHRRTVVASGEALAEVAQEALNNGFNDSYYEWIPPLAETPPVIIL